ncbi:MAG TPA: PKD domain-containing protein [Bacteroidia bacterium]|nr:PKD domain-containing protein [Bacteroidia bacterium]HNT80425.1 PKD domain-containing protein [Bacteroidia bacterium]
MKNLIIILSLLSIGIHYTANSQIVFWSESFNNGCTQNCLLTSYNSTNGNWTIINSGTNGSHANNFFVSCSENGNAVGSCGTGCGNDATLHVGSVPCTLCIFCPTGDCGASYNAGPTFLGEDPTTHKRATSPIISTIGKTNITLSFKYLENGQGNTDDAYIEYNVGNGWVVLSNTPKTSTNCAPQGEWTLFNMLLPSVCENISNLQLGIVWKNNSDGIGSDPSFAIDNIELSTNTLAPPIAGFTVSSLSFCDSTCIQFTDTSIGSSLSYNWYFPGGTPNVSSNQNPGNICYNVPGMYDVTLVIANSGGSDSITLPSLIQVNPCYIPTAFFTASDTVFCEEYCIDFFDLSINTPTMWQWSFPGASPSFSTVQNPTNVCYIGQGTYPVTLIASNGTGGDTSTIISYIHVLPNPPAPTITILGGNTLISSPGVSYQWYLNSSPIAGAVFQVYTATQAGSYTVSTFDSSGCFAASQPAIILSTEEYEEDYFTVFPNPALDRILVKFAKYSADKIEVFNLMGQDISHSVKKSELSELEIELTISNLENGVYFLQLSWPDKIMRNVFVKAE